jgi:3-hydroxyacyl-[acyl-carrier-protein] dehydratase
MNPRHAGNLPLGSNVVELLLPQRRPFLMVDCIRSFHSSPAPTLEASRLISANESVFEGHFPGFHLWPGALTIEGLGQTGVLLMALLTLQRAAAADGEDPQGVLEALLDLDRWLRLQPGSPATSQAKLLGRIRAARGLIAVGTSVELKFLQPVYAGQRLDYRMRLTGEHAGGTRFEAEAAVEGTVVARGVMGGMVVRRPVLPGAAQSTE